MKLFQFRGAHPNFGDELNSWLWPKLLPGFLDEDPAQHFIGIGSTIGDAPRDASRKIVFGAGFAPHYHTLPNVHDGKWHVYFVRGPRTAQRLHLASEMAIGDSAILLRQCHAPAVQPGTQISFIPHWESMDRGHWQEACALAGITLIDSRAPVDAVLAQLMQSKLVIAEAMHGAIVADALRIPWVAVVPLNTVHRDKWYDWAEALGVTLNPQKLWPSSLVELQRKAPISSVGNRDGDMPVASVSRLSQLKQYVQHSPCAPWIDRRLTDMAAQRLRQLARVEGMLSSDTAITTATSRMLDKLEQLKRDYAPSNARAALA